jgi:hypothetical protein
MTTIYVLVVAALLALWWSRQFTAPAVNDRRLFVHIAATLIVPPILVHGSIALQGYLPEPLGNLLVLTLGQVAIGYVLLVAFWVIRGSAGALAPRFR